MQDVVHGSHVVSVVGLHTRRMSNVVVGRCSGFDDYDTSEPSAVRGVAG
jgi:hypothetical protein